MTLDPDLALAGILESIANTLKAHPHHDNYPGCACIRCRTHTYTAHGYPASTLGDGGSRSSDRTSSTERAATETTRLFPGLDQQWATLTAQLTQLGVDTLHILAVVLSHAPDDDVLPGGTGHCTVPTCDTFCNPRKKPDNRLRAGLCPACHQAWLRYQRRTGNAERPAFLAHRGKELAGDTRTQPNKQVVA